MARGIARGQVMVANADMPVVNSKRASLREFPRDASDGLALHSGNVRDFLVR